MSITRTLGTSMIRFEESRLTACIEAACQGVDYDLELLCHLAPEDSDPLVRVLDRVSNEPRPNPLLRGRSNLLFTPDCVEPLRVALIGNEPLRAALLRLWTCRACRGQIPPFFGYPGAALESLVRGGDPEAITVYTEWFPTTLNGVTEPHLVPADLLQVPSIRAAALALAQETARGTFEGYDDDGKRMYKHLFGTVEVMHSLRSLWVEDPRVCSAIDEGVGCDDLGRALFAISVLGKRHLTDDARRVLSDVISRSTRADDIEGVCDLIQALMLSASTPISEQHMELLRELALSEHPARFAAGFALLPALDERQARELSVELCRRWPNLNWSFYYSRYEELLPALVKPAPSTWASRCKQVGIRDGLDVARLILSRLGRAEREDFLAHLVMCGSHWQLPWLSLAGRPRNERLLDSVLEVVYDSGIGLEAYCGWLGHGFPWSAPARGAPRSRCPLCQS